MSESENRREIVVVAASRQMPQGEQVKRTMHSFDDI
jgi:hypothetical protein